MGRFPSGMNPSLIIIALLPLADLAGGSSAGTGGLESAIMIGEEGESTGTIRSGNQPRIFRTPCSTCSTLICIMHGTEWHGLLYPKMQQG